MHLEVPRDGVLDAVVVGAGVSGIAMAVGLLRRGVRRLAVLEQADDVGGTWRDNRYPGCACDVPARLYSFSFAANPSWSRTYAGQPEIQAYVRRVAHEQGVLPYVRLRTRFVDAAWEGASASWRVVVEGPDGRDVLRTRVLVVSTGPLSRPALPQVRGLGRFTGRVVHTAEWPEGLDLTGQRVAVVGTGASAIQVVPELAGRVPQLHVVQRTPAWVLPRGDRPVPSWVQEAYRRVPALERAARAATYVQREALVPGFVRDPRLLGGLAWLARRHLRRSVPDPVLRRALTPDYRIGCKRILASDDFYPALLRPDVELLASPLAAVDGSRVRVADGREREVDVLVLATGFRVTEALPELPVTGRGGVTLAERWAGGVSAYAGASVPGFPNLFLLLGPNTGLGHTSVLFMAEAQVQHVLAAAAPVLDRRAGAVEVSAAAAASWDADVQRRMGRTVWASGCRSWYQDASGRNPVLWPGSTVRFWRTVRRPPRDAYVRQAAREHPRAQTLGAGAR